MGLDNFKFVTREVVINEIIQGKNKDIRVIMIGVLDESSGIIYPHPLSDFIKKQYEYHGKSLNSSDAPAKEVCKFLNFCMQNIKNNEPDFIHLKDKGVKGLKRIHGSHYLTHLTMKGLQKSTVEQYEKYLTAFFIYLKKMHFIDEDFSIETKTNAKGDIANKSIFREPFLATRFPSHFSKKDKSLKLKDFGEDRAELTAHFIRIAMDIAPDIALGLCFQFYGGLRRGEVVNLDRDSLIVAHGESMEVQIKDNRKSFFAHLKDTKAENPKRLNYLGANLTRQTILDNDLVWRVYDQHMKRLAILYKSNLCQNTSALFFDKDGKPMSGKVYERRFNKVKKAFIDSLIGHKSYELIADTVWNTHIGRGVFTNTLINMGFTPTQLAIARGDRNINSAMSYIDETLTTQQLKDAINELKSVSNENLGIIDYNSIRKLKQKV